MILNDHIDCHFPKTKHGSFEPMPLEENIIINIGLEDTCAEGKCVEKLPKQ